MRAKTTTEPTKKLVQFLKADFEKAQQKFSSSTKLQSEIKKELKTLLPDSKHEFDFNKDLMQQYYDVLENNINNTYGLRGEAIAQLQNKDLTKLKKLVSEYTPATAPALADFSIFTENEQELDRYNALTNLVQAYRQFMEIDNSDLNVLQITRAIPYRARIDTTTAPPTITPELHWLKTGTIRILG
jgi:hypothetical protein